MQLISVYFDSEVRVFVRMVTNSYTYLLRDGERRLILLPSHTQNKPSLKGPVILGDIYFRYDWKC